MGLIGRPKTMHHFLGHGFEYPLSLKNIMESIKCYPLSRMPPSWSQLFHRGRLQLPCFVGQRPWCCHGLATQGAETLRALPCLAAGGWNWLAGCDSSIRSPNHLVCAVFAVKIDSPVEIRFFWRVFLRVVARDRCCCTIGRCVFCRQTWRGTAGIHPT